MFLNYLKGIAAKKIVKKRLSDLFVSPSIDKVRTVGIVIDESFSSHIMSLFVILEQHGIDRSNVKCLIYRNAGGKSNEFPDFSIADLGWNGKIKSSPADAFLNTRFDVLISYYDLEKPGLLAATDAAAASFKVGFSTVDKRLNHLLIDANPANPEVFIRELFRYLKILNKI